MDVMISQSLKDILVVDGILFVILALPGILFPKVMAKVVMVESPFPTRKKVILQILAILLMIDIVLICGGLPFFGINPFFE